MIVSAVIHSVVPVPFLRPLQLQLFCGSRACVKNLQIKNYIGQLLQGSLPQLSPLTSMYSEENPDSYFLPVSLVTELSVQWGW